YIGIYAPTNIFHIGGLKSIIEYNDEAPRLCKPLDVRQVSRPAPCVVYDFPETVVLPDVPSETVIRIFRGRRVCPEDCFFTFGIENFIGIQYTVPANKVIQA